MNKKAIKIFLIVIITVSFTFGEDVFLLDVKGAIDPPIYEYIRIGIQKAKESDATLVVITLDTPGGLMSSTKDIVAEILGSDIPVAVFVYPAGSRAASAGVFISMAAHISAMAPGTHIGAAHPVTIGPPNDTSTIMREKVTNDAVAWLKSLARLRKRNIDWAIQSVKKSQSITAVEAESLNIIDIVAKDLNELFEKIEQFSINFDDTTVQISLNEPSVNTLEMTLQQKFLHTILNPNLAYLLMILGIIGLYLEFQNPGMIFPGVIGVISILSAIYAFQILPVNYVGILLIIAGIVMFILETQIPGFGLLTSGGIIAMLLGSFMLTSGNPPALKISWWTIIPTVAFVAILFIFIVAKALMIQRKKVTTGYDGLVGEIGEVIVEIPPDGVGKVLTHGEIWNAKSSSKLSKGTPVKIVKVDRMTIWVEEIE
ncbi:nodulation protein NfeD [bacterium]|nr:MAG: nodulation protein NfeD [bacterium]